MLIWEQKYVRQREDSSGKEEQGPPLNQAIIGSGFSVTSKDCDIESSPWNEWSRMEKIASLNDCREGSSGYNSFSSDSSK
jgi:hypothetical protein